MRALPALFFVTLIVVVPASAATPLLTQLGLKSGMEYSSAKERMLHRGWSVDAPEPANHRPYASAPEVTCGQGWDAVCTARFINRGKAVMLTLKPGIDKLTVLDAEPD